MTKNEEHTQGRLTKEAIIAQKEADLRRRQEESRKEQAAMLGDLARAGYDVESVWDFVNTADKYPAAIPVLLRHLKLPYSPRTREGIIRALTVDYAGPEVLHELLRQFLAERETRFNSPKWVLGNAIAEVATPADAETMIAIATDPSHGEARHGITQRLPRVVKDKKRLNQILQLLMHDKQMQRFAHLAARGQLY
jgi:hypothetical protein